MPEDRHPGTPGGGSGADVKSGKVMALSDASSILIVFGTPFTSTPRITATLDMGEAAVDIVRAGSITTAQFRLAIHKGHGGSSHLWDVYWIATDAGNP